MNIYKLSLSANSIKLNVKVIQQRDDKDSNNDDDFQNCKLTTATLDEDFEENFINSNMNPPGEEDEKTFSDKSEELHNSISSLSEIPESYWIEQKKEFTPPDGYENPCDMAKVCGLSDVKETLFSVFIYPTNFPQFFPRNIRLNQILLYGPPGTGKTMLAKAIALEINAKFHKISSSDLLSHWQGETEKRIRSLFEEVRNNSEPTILFFDEIDGLCRRRTQTEDDSVRRIKTELLTQLDDCVSESETHQTFIMGATNCPWEIDSGFMRRFHKKIFIPLPDKEARLDILKKNFGEIKTDLTDTEWDNVGKMTEGYSGSDLVNVVMSSCTERFKQMKNCKYWEVKGDLWVPTGSFSLFSTRINFEDIHPQKVGCRNIIFDDLKAGVEKTSKSVGPEELIKYLDFSEKVK